MDDTILSGDLRLSAHFALPTTPGPSLGLVLCHGLPNPPRGAATVGTTYPDLADHIANEAGWAVLTFNFRGTGTSEGDFSARDILDTGNLAPGNTIQNVPNLLRPVLLVFFLRQSRQAALPSAGSSRGRSTLRRSSASCPGAWPSQAPGR